MEECVMDAELFEKFSSDDFSTANRDHKYKNIWELFENEPGRFSHRDSAEFKCLLHFLNDIVIRSKYAVCVDPDIKGEYKKFVKKLPPELRGPFYDLMQRSDLFKEVEGKLDIREKGKFKNTPLEKEMIHINVANSLSNRLIISTYDDIDNNYAQCCDILFPVGSKDICTAFEKSR